MNCLYCGAPLNSAGACVCFAWHNARLNPGLLNCEHGRLEGAFCPHCMGQDQMKPCEKCGCIMVNKLVCVNCSPDAFYTILTELKQLRTMLANLLAVIHRDGGHHQEAHGLVASCDEAMRLSSERIALFDVKPLRWSTDRPTKRGWWWVYWDGDAAPSTVFVDEDDGRLRITLHDDGAIDFVWLDAVVQPAKWAGPIQPPPSTRSPK